MYTQSFLMMSAKNLINNGCPGELTYQIETCIYIIRRAYLDIRDLLDIPVADGGN